jgi:hypothetical protein
MDTGIIAAAVTLIGVCVSTLGTVLIARQKTRTEDMSGKIGKLSRSLELNGDRAELHSKAIGQILSGTLASDYYRCMEQGYAKPHTKKAVAETYELCAALGLNDYRKYLHDAIFALPDEKIKKTQTKEKTKQ